MLSDHTQYGSFPKPVDPLSALIDSLSVSTFASRHYWRYRSCFSQQIIIHPRWQYLLTELDIPLQPREDDYWDRAVLHFVLDHKHRQKMAHERVIQLNPPEQKQKNANPFPIDESLILALSRAALNHSLSMEEVDALWAEECEALKKSAGEKNIDFHQRYNTFTTNYLENPTQVVNDKLIQLRKKFLKMIGPSSSLDAFLVDYEKIKNELDYYRAAFEIPTLTLAQLCGMKTSTHQSFIHFFYSIGIDIIPHCNFYFLEEKSKLMDELSLRLNQLESMAFERQRATYINRDLSSDDYGNWYQQLTTDVRTITRQLRSRLDEPRLPCIEQPTDNMISLLARLNLNPFYFYMISINYPLESLKEKITEAMRNIPAPQSPRIRPAINGI